MDILVQLPDSFGCMFTGPERVQTGGRLSNNGIAVEVKQGVMVADVVSPEVNFTNILR